MSKRVKLYQPFVEAENVRKLYELKTRSGKPMTVLINEAVVAYYESAQSDEKKEEEA